MDDLQLTELFVKRRKLADELAEIDEYIKGHILERGETFAAAGVKATYYQPSKSYDYQEAAKDAPADVVSQYTTMKEYISWQKVCEHLGIDDIPFDEKPPRVVIK